MILLDILTHLTLLHLTEQTSNNIRSILINFIDSLKRKNKKGIIFLDPNDLHISQETRLILNEVHVTNLDLLVFIYNEKDKKYFVDLSKDEFAEEYVSIEDIMMELGRDYIYPLS